VAFPAVGLGLSPEQWALRLMTELEAERVGLRMLNDYYEGTQKLTYMHPELLAQFEGRMREVVINWPRMVVDAVEERLDVEGFRRKDDPDADDTLWYWWQANRLDELSQQGHIDALTMRRSFVCIGAPDPGTDFPRITVESPLEMWADIDPRTRQVRAALRRWYDFEGAIPGEERRLFATLYLPNSTTWYQVEGDGWTVIDQDDHMLGVVPVVPLVNRPRLKIPLGVSELADVFPLSDAANKIATDMMVSAEFHAMPRRYALGFDKADFAAPDGSPLKTWQQVAGEVWATSASAQDGASVGQFPESQLTNFHNTINCLAQLVASMAGLPPYYFGQAADQPASAQAIVASLNRLIKRSERKARSFGGTWEQAMRIAELVMTGAWNPASRQLETIWRNPATPTKAEQADASMKLYQSGITPLRQTREDLGYTAVQIERMEKQDVLADPAMRLSALDPAAAIVAKPGGLDDGKPLPQPDPAVAPRPLATQV
jgi:hypothetical protein